MRAARLMKNVVSIFPEDKEAFLKRSEQLLSYRDIMSVRFEFSNVFALCRGPQLSAAQLHLARASTL